MAVDVKQDAVGVWYAQPYLGTLVDGRQKRPRKSFPEATTRAQAQALATEWLEKITNAGKVQSYVLADMLTDYRANAAVRGYSPNTIKRWELFTDTYVKPYLKGRTVSELTAADFESFELRLLRPKEKGGQGLSRSSVRSVHYFLRGAYRKWVKAGVCEVNPLLYIEPPKEDKSEAAALDEWDFKRFADNLEQDMRHDGAQTAVTMRTTSYAIGMWLSLHTGMRLGEVCALRRRDVYRTRGYIHVCGTVIEVKGGGVLRKDVTKGRVSRNVSLTEREFAEIFRVIASQDAYFAEFDPNTPLVTVDGAFMRPSTLSKAFTRKKRKLGMKKECSFHSLRHTHATWLLANGASIKDIADRLGHVEETTTLKTYAHAMPGRDQKAAETFADFAERLQNDTVNDV